MKFSKTQYSNVIHESNIVLIMVHDIIIWRYYMERIKTHLPLNSQHDSKYNMTV